MKRKAGSAIRTASDGLGDGSDGESRKKTKRERKGKVVDEGVNAIETAAEPLPAVVDDIAQDEAAPPTSTEPTDPPAEIGDGAKQKKKKKKSKKSGKGREGADAAKTEVADDSRPVEPTATEEAPKKEDEANGEAKAEADGDDAAAPTANHRFIVFVGAFFALPARVPPSLDFVGRFWPFTNQPTHRQPPLHGDDGVGAGALCVGQTALDPAGHEARRPEKDAGLGLCRVLGPGPHEDGAGQAAPLRVRRRRQPEAQDQRGADVSFFPLWVEDPPPFQPTRDETRRHGLT